jgi:hypothetical protein
MLAFQTVDQRLPIDRKKHVWLGLRGGYWKCCLCGGVTRSPSHEGLPERFEPLNDLERGECPPPRPPTKKGR